MRGVILAVTFMALVLTLLVILTGKITQETVPQSLGKRNSYMQI